MLDTDNSMQTQEGGCTCRYIRYRMSGKPLFVHCCHCSWCQRETGSAFVLNAMIETERVQLLEGEVQMIDTPSNSGKGQHVARCPKCFVALWSHYAGAGEAVRFLRVGTLDNPHAHAPDVHIFTSTKQPWLRLPDGVPVFAEFYKPAELWPQDTLNRYAALKAKK
jgi:hypothetical protein